MELTISPRRAFQLGFILSALLAGVYLALLVMSIGAGGPGSANVNQLSVQGYGDAQIRTDTPEAADFASAKGSNIAYDSKLDWGTSPGTTFSSSFLIASASEDGKWRNAYRVKGQGADHQISFEATKISGDASFASTITLTANEASAENFDSTVSFDTRDGNATISGRVYNSTTGKPATLQELDLVGKYLLEHNLNVSQPAITPKGWLEFCSDLNKDNILSGDDALGIYIAPEGYHIDDSGRLVRDEEE